MNEFLVRHEIDADLNRMRNPVAYRVAFVLGNRLLESREGQFIISPQELTSPPRPTNVQPVPERYYYQQGDVLFEAEIDHQEARRLFPHEFATESQGFLDVVFLLVDAKIKVGWQIDQLETVSPITFDGVCRLQAVILDDTVPEPIPIKHPKLVFINRKALHSFFEEMELQSQLRWGRNALRLTAETLIWAAASAMTAGTAGGARIATTVARNALRREFVRRLLRQQFARRVVQVFIKFPKTFAVAFAKSFAKAFAEVKSRAYTKRQPVTVWLNGPEFYELILKATNAALHEVLSDYMKEQGWLKSMLNESKLSALKQLIATRLAGEIKQLWLDLHAGMVNMVIEQFFVDKKLTGSSFLKLLEEKLTSTDAIRDIFLRQLEASLQEP